MRNILSRFSYDDLKVVLAVGEHGNLSRASEALDINHSTLFRRLGTIENVLGLSLFLRRRSQYVPTVPGAELISLAHRVEDDVNGVLQSITEEVRGFSGEIRLTTSDALLYDYLVPLIASFTAKNPKISFSVSIGNESANLSEGQADVAFRATYNVPEHLSGRKIGSATWAVYGNRKEWEGKQIDCDHLHELEWSSFGHSLSKLKAFMWVDSNVPKEKIRFRGSSVLSVAAAVSGGIGVGLLPCMHGDENDNLVRISPVIPEIKEDLWFLAHPDVRKSAKVREFMNHCIQHLTDERSNIFGIIP